VAQGGKDASQARYVSTRLEKIARAVFPQADDNVLTYLDDDGLQIEPQWYVLIASFHTDSVRGLAVHSSLDEFFISSRHGVPLECSERSKQMAWLCQDEAVHFVCSAF
jgi:hypothetical protein